MVSDPPYETGHKVTKTIRLKPHDDSNPRKCSTGGSTAPISGDLYRTLSKLLGTEDLLPNQTTWFKRYPKLETIWEAPLNYPAAVRRFLSSDWEDTQNQWTEQYQFKLEEPILKSGVDLEQQLKPVIHKMRHQLGIYNLTRAYVNNRNQWPVPTEPSKGAYAAMWLHATSKANYTTELYKRWFEEKIGHKVNCSTTVGATFKSKCHNSVPEENLQRGGILQLEVNAYCSSVSNHQSLGPFGRGGHLGTNEIYTLSAASCRNHLEDQISPSGSLTRHWFDKGRWARGSLGTTLFGGTVIIKPPEQITCTSGSSQNSLCQRTEVHYEVSKTSGYVNQPTNLTLHLDAQLKDSSKADDQSEHPLMVPGENRSWLFASSLAHEKSDRPNNRSLAPPGHDPTQCTASRNNLGDAIDDLIALLAAYQEHTIDPKSDPDRSQMYVLRLLIETNLHEKYTPVEGY